jgi:NodT family efflux transporter outer membrane factor (OMF) lipoprotein
MQRFLAIPLLAAAATLAACTVGPNYRPPRVAMDDTFGPASATQPATQPSNSVAAWWQSLNDPLLDQLVARATAANLDVRQAAARIRQARAQLAVTTGGRYPGLNADAGFTHQRFSQNAAPFNAFNVPGFPWEFNLYQMGFDASWEVDVFGGTRRAVQAAAADIAAGIEDRRAIQVSVAAEVARNYVLLRGYQLEAQLARDNLQLQRESLGLTQEQMNKGVGTQLDVSRAQAEVAATEAAIPLLERNGWLAVHRIALLLNEPVEKLDFLQQARPIPATPDAVAVGVPAELLRRRPDIRRAERRLAAATARVGQAEAALYPRFSLTGFFNLQSASIDDLFMWKSRAFSIGPTIQWPIFDAGTLRAAVQVRSASQEEALAGYESTVRQAVTEVRDGLVSFTTERRRRGALAEAVAADRTALDLAQQLYRQGLTDFLTVLDAERELFAAQDALARSDTEQATALIGLYKALGGGWETGTNAPSPDNHP